MRSSSTTRPALGFFLRAETKHGWSLPGANLLEVGDWGLRQVTYEELALVQHWRRDLDEPMRCLRHVL